MILSLVLHFCPAHHRSAVLSLKHSLQSGGCHLPHLVVWMSSPHSGCVSQVFRCQVIFLLWGCVNTLFLIVLSLANFSHHCSFSWKQPLLWCLPSDDLLTPSFLHLSIRNPVQGKGRTSPFMCFFSYLFIFVWTQGYLDYSKCHNPFLPLLFFPFIFHL